MEEHETPMMEDPVSDPPHSNVERDNIEDSLDTLNAKEPVELVETSLNEPPSKRIFAWFRYILQEEKKHGPPLGTSREKRSLGIYLGYVA